MKDRTPKYPGRVKLVPVDAANGIYDIIRADEPTEAGDPLNKSTFLTDETAALLGLDGNAVPNDAFAALASYTHAGDVSDTHADLLSWVDDMRGNTSGFCPEDITGKPEGTGSGNVFIWVTGAGERTIDFIETTTQKRYTNSTKNGSWTGWREVAVIFSGTYVGTGRYGGDGGNGTNRNNIEFPFKPKMVFISGTTYGAEYGRGREKAIFYVDALPESYVDGGYLVSGSTGMSDAGTSRAGFWDNTLFWYSNSSAFAQLNEFGVTYSYIAIG